MNSSDIKLKDTSDMTVKELTAELRQRGAKLSGRKVELIARLDAIRQSSCSPPPVITPAAPAPTSQNNHLCNTNNNDSGDDDGGTIAPLESGKLKCVTDMTVQELKEELRLRKAPLRGKKADLAERLDAYRKNNNFLVDIPGNESAEKPAFPIPDDPLFKDINCNTSLPKLSHLNLTAYLCRFNKTSTTAESMYENGFLNNVRHAKWFDFHYLKGTCHAEKRKKVSYFVHVKVANSGFIEGTHCECAAGEGGEAHCKHIIVVVLGAIDMVENGRIILRKACTETLQTFHQPSKAYFGTPLKASVMKKKSEEMNCDLNNLDPRPVKYRVLDHKSWIFNLISAFPNSTMPFKHLLTPANPYAYEIDHGFYCKEHPLKIFLRSYFLSDITDADVARIENETRGQSSNPLWFFYRQVRITASHFYEVCHVVSEEACVALAKRLLCVNKNISSEALTHGLVYEAQAVKDFMCKYHGALEAKECGLFVSKDYPFLGASPDRLLAVVTIIEVKCPFTAKDNLINEFTVPYLTRAGDGTLILKKDDPYYYQVQGQLAITKRQFCVFVVYTFCDMIDITVERDEEFIQEMFCKLSNFNEKYFQPAVLEKYYYREYNSYF